MAGVDRLALFAILEDGATTDRRQWFIGFLGATLHGRRIVVILP
jgi:hypothetical protein